MQQFPFEVERASLQRTIGCGSVVRGEKLAQRQAVREITWDPEGAVLRGFVRDPGGNERRVAALLSVSDGRPSAFAEGKCDCPGRGHCMHVAALVLAMPHGSHGTSPAGVPAAGWARLVPEPAVRRTLPLAIELALADRHGQPPTLTARLVQPGQGDAARGPSWATLSEASWLRDYSERQLRLLHSLYRIYKASGGRDCYTYKRLIDFSVIDSPDLWPLLRTTAAADLPLVYEGTGNRLPAYEEATFHMDVTRGTHGGRRVTPVVQSGDRAPAVLVAFVGATGHGAVCVDRETAAAEPPSQRFRLVRLAEPVPPRLQRIALTAEREWPADKETSFRVRQYPWLRKIASVISSDGSFDLPSISEPTLVLRACYGTGHDLDLSWDWAYQIGDIPVRASVDATEPDQWYRDLHAERELLAGLRLPLQRYRLGWLGGRVPVLNDRPTRLTGLETMRFSTELLPRLRRTPGLVVEVGGQPADYRDTGNSLRITLATDEVASEIDWFDLKFTINVDGHAIPFLDVFVALSQHERHLMLPDGAYFSLDRPELRVLARLIAEARALRDDGLPRISRYQTGLWDEMAALGVSEDEAAAWQQQVRELLSSGPVGRVEPPAGFSAGLRPYQQEGFDWLTYLWEHRLGGILADEMGLGKTLQCLALIGHARERDREAPPFLIVAPTSVVANWEAEARRFAPGLTVAQLTSTVARRGRPLGELVAGADAVVTSYTLLRLDFTAYAALNWSGLLLDEAQNVKSWQTKIYKCARDLPAPVKFAITGTPLENNLRELWAVLSLTSPGLFPSPERFLEYYARPIEDKGNHERAAQLRRQIEPFVKRRTKAEVTPELPDKYEHVLEIDLHAPHRELYELWLQWERYKVLGLDGHVPSRFTRLCALTELRQLSLHAGLINEAYARLPSAKIDTLAGRLREVTDGGHTSLVYSQYTRFLAKVRERLDAEGLPYFYLDGNTTDRAGLVRRFQHGAAPVFLISLKAGGAGLNLTAADHCFLLDPWWNPATEAQAVARAHRIGQTRDVTVYRLVARNTVEQRLLQLQARKARVFDGVLGDGHAFSAASLDDDDIRDMFS